MGFSKLKPFPEDSVSELSATKTGGEQKSEFDLSALLNKLKALFCEYVYLNEQYAIFFALWVTHTYFINFIGISPLLIIKHDDYHYDAKLTLTILLMTLARNPFRASTVNTRVLLDNFQYEDITVLFDDCSVIKNRDMLNLIQNARYRTDAIRYTRIKDENWQFQTFGAKVIVSDHDLPISILNSGMTIHLDNPKICSRPPRITEADRDALEELKKGLKYFAKCFSEQVAEVDPDLPDDLTNYEKDNWLPLFKIAQIAGEAWVENAKKASESISSISKQDSLISEELLIDVYNIVNADESKEIGSEVLKSTICSIPGRPWATYDRGGCITSVQVAKLLKKFGIKSKNMRFTISDEGRILKGYDKSKIVEAYQTWIEFPFSVNRQK